MWFSSPRRSIRFRQAVDRAPVTALAGAPWPVTAPQSATGSRALLRAGVVAPAHAQAIGSARVHHIRALRAAAKRRSDRGHGGTNRKVLGAVKTAGDEVTVPVPVVAGHLMTGRAGWAVGSRAALGLAHARAVGAWLFVRAALPGADIVAAHVAVRLVTRAAQRVGIFVAAGLDGDAAATALLLVWAAVVRADTDPARHCRIRCRAGTSSRQGNSRHSRRTSCRGSGTGSYSIDRMVGRPHPGTGPAPPGTAGPVASASGALASCDAWAFSCPCSRSGTPRAPSARPGTCVLASWTTTASPLRPQPARAGWRHWSGRLPPGATRRGDGSSLHRTSIVSMHRTVRIPSAASPLPDCRAGRCSSLRTGLRRSAARP